MATMPIVGVSGSIKQDESGQFINANYLANVLAAGAIPVVLCLDMDAAQVAQCLDRLDGVLLCGGNDVDPSRFGESPAVGLGEVNPKRDRLENYVIAEAYRRGMPLLAICRGVQMLNVALGGTLYQDIPTQYLAHTGTQPLSHASLADASNPMHDVRVVQSTLLHTLYGADALCVNSFHHQAIKSLSPRLQVAARSADGVVEAVYDSTQPFVLGVQWHPERMAEGAPLFQAFAAACDRYRARSQR